MLLSLSHFCLLRPRAQLLHVHMNGTYLAQRWRRIGFARLYHLADGGRGFFIEVGLDAAQEGFVVLRSSRHSVLWEEYTQELRLPE